MTTEVCPWRLLPFSSLHCLIHYKPYHITVAKRIWSSKRNHREIPCDQVCGNSLLWGSCGLGVCMRLQWMSVTTWYKKLTHWKRCCCWERLRAGGEGDNREWDGWMAWVWVGDGQGGLACCRPWNCKESDTTERLNWTDGFELLSNVF